MDNIPIPDVAGKLGGRTAVVTGGASGIGRATAKRMAQEGASVVVVDVRQAAVDDAVAELNSIASGTGAHLGLALDVRSEEDMGSLAARTLKAFGHIDILVASAGILRGTGSVPKPLVDIDVEEWDQVLDTNLKGVFLSNRAVLPSMIQRGSGNIVNISSLSGKQGRAHDGPYCASKFGVIGLSESLAEEVRGHGVRVQVVLPGVVDTPLWDQNGPVPPPSDTLSADRVAEFVLYLITQPADTMLAAPVMLPIRVRRRKEKHQQTGNSIHE